MIIDAVMKTPFGFDRQSLLMNRPCRVALGQAEDGIELSLIGFDPRKSDSRGRVVYFCTLF